uniref:Uncharacterized protein n=1 Tax=Arundo donax TaxID=35708 RepID=A0A0A9ARL6_ARUDO
MAPAAVSPLDDHTATNPTFGWKSCCEFTYLGSQLSSPNLYTMGFS